MENDTEKTLLTITPAIKLIAELSGKVISRQDLQYHCNVGNIEYIKIGGIRFVEENNTISFAKKYKTRKFNKTIGRPKKDKVLSESQ